MLTNTTRLCFCYQSNCRAPSRFTCHFFLDVDTNASFVQSHPVASPGNRGLDSPASALIPRHMKSILWLLLAFYAASNAAPVGILREGRYAVKVEVTAASTSQFTNKAVTVKACCLDTTTDVDAWQATQDMALSSFFADSTPRKLASSCGICLNGSGASGHNRGRNQLHRISLTGVRDLVAVVMLGFAVVSGFACSCLRR